MSWPRPAQTTSRPPSDRITSSPARARTTSRPPVPTRLLSPAVPTIVATLPWQVGCAGGGDPAALTLVVAVSVLLAFAGSFSADVTVAELVMLPGFVGRT